MLRIIEDMHPLVNDQIDYFRNFLTGYSERTNVPSLVVAHGMTGAIVQISMGEYNLVLVRGAWKEMHLLGVSWIALRVDIWVGVMQAS